MSPVTRRFGQPALVALALALAVAVIAAGSARALPSTTVVINEVDYDQPSTDAAEFLELRNVSASAINLDTYTVELVNGNAGGAVIYQTIDLPNVNLAAGDYYVVCANPATTTNCDLDVAPDTNLIQNGAPDGIGLKLSGTLVDALSYEGNTGAPYTEASGSGLDDTGASATRGLSRCADGADTDQNSVDFVLKTITPGAANDCGTPPPSLVCGNPATAIHDVQGPGAASPVAGSVRRSRASSPETSRAPASSTASSCRRRQPKPTRARSPRRAVRLRAHGAGRRGRRPRPGKGHGHRVLLEDRALERDGRRPLLRGSTAARRSADAVMLPVSSLGDFEPLEGMRVTFPHPLSIAETFNYDRFGELVLANGRQFQPTAVHEPGSPAAAALTQANALGRITLDDGSTVQNPNPLLHPNGVGFGLANLFRSGDTVARPPVWSTTRSSATIQPARRHLHAGEPAAGHARLGRRQRDGRVLQRPQLLHDARKPRCEQRKEFLRQRTKIIAAINELDAEIVGLIEIENNQAAIGDLVDRLNAAAGAGAWAFVDTGVIGSDEIRVAFIYKPASVTRSGTSPSSTRPSIRASWTRRTVPPSRKPSGRTPRAASSPRSSTTSSRRAPTATTSAIQTSATARATATARARRLPGRSSTGSPTTRPPAATTTSWSSAT